MSEERRRILNMLAVGKINAGEAEALLDALSRRPGSAIVPMHGQTPNTTVLAKYLRVLVEGQLEGQAHKVNVRIPIELIRAGMRLAALLPQVAYEPVNRALKENGVDLDVSKLRPEDLEGLVTHLHELHVDVDDGNDKVRVFCE